MHSLKSGIALTKYTDGKVSGCEPQVDDSFHGEKLGISDKHHRLVHEIIHHVVGFMYYDFKYGSPIIYRDAYGIEQPEEEAKEEEWIVTALTYVVYAKPFHDKGYDHAWNHMIEKGKNPSEMMRMIRWLIEVPPEIREIYVAL